MINYKIVKSLDIGKGQKVQYRMDKRIEFFTRTSQWTQFFSQG